MSTKHPRPLPRDKLLVDIANYGLPAPVLELMFAKPRRWRFDMAWPDNGKLAVEVEGGTWINGRHNRGAGLAKDCEKYNNAIALGWRVLRFTSDQILDNQAIEFITKFF